MKHNASVMQALAAACCGKMAFQGQLLVGDVRMVQYDMSNDIFAERSTRMRKYTTGLLVSLTILMMLSVAAYADSTAITLTSYQDFTNGQWSLGFEFIPQNNITVTTLGSFFPVGATDQHGVAIWTETGTQLASATVTGTGTEGFVFGAITPLHLLAGVEYIISASTLSDPYADFNATWTVAPGITYVDHIETPCSTVAACFPTNRTTGFGDFGANFQFTTGGAVPEPASLFLLGSGLLSLGGLARKRMKKR